MPHQLLWSSFRILSTAEASGILMEEEDPSGYSEISSGEEYEPWVGGGEEIVGYENQILPTYMEGTMKSTSPIPHPMVHALPM